MFCLCNTSKLHGTRYLDIVMECCFDFVCIYTGRWNSKRKSVCKQYVLYLEVPSIEHRKDRKGGIYQPLKGTVLENYKRRSLVRKGI